ncbi:hypothetical protein [Larkinella terrae]|uniref:Glycosyltransferase RgtA/B/C/D-like domain-containing protein n=1 Tax=Larkinella terrae TaxID=2025311 RepID=A0A7K0EPI6_9BACT|nr:hypothetical protein [Larkinella terrae]MRS63717.1 hypothetical protein [Larkinella terrae]
MKDRYFDGISLFLIALASYVLNHQITAISNIEMGDEGFYMYQGITGFRLGLQTDWGPIYSLWYKFLSFFESDTVRLYYLNMVLMSSLTTLAIYIAIRLAGFRWWWALYSALVFHFSQINFPQGVKVSIFLFLSTLILYIVCDRYFRNQIYKALVITTFSYFVFTYIRPEVIVSFGLCMAVLIGATIRFRKSPLPLAGITVGILLIFFGIGSPLSDKGQSAFKQDFSYNYNMQHMEDERLKPYNNWVDYEVMSRIIFGEPVKGFADALVKHPALVIENHILFNITNLSKQLLNIIYSYVEPVSKLPGLRFIERVFYIKLAWILLLIIGIAVVSFRKTAQNLAAEVTKNPLPYLMSSLAILAPCISSVYSMGTKIRYLPPFYFFFPLFIGLLVTSIHLRPWLVHRMSWEALTRPGVKYGLQFIFLTGIALFLLWGWKRQVPKMPGDNELVEYVKDLTAPVKDKDRIRIFDNKDQLITYIGGNAVSYADYPRNTDFFKFVDQKDINLIVFRPIILDYYKADTSLQRFIQNPPPAFIKKDGPKPGGYSFIRRDLLVN